MCVLLLLFFCFCFCYLSWVLFVCLFSSPFFFFLFSFFFLWPCSMACGLLVPQPGIRPWPPEWEHRVYDAGLPENSWAQGILIGMHSPRGIHLDTKSLLHPTACRLQCWTLHVKQPARQPYSSADRLPKVILSSQTPQNTPPDAALPIREKRLSSTHQSTDTSPSHQEAYTSPWTKLTHQGADNRSKRNYNPAACRKTANTVS